MAALPLHNPKHTTSGSSLWVGCQLVCPLVPPNPALLPLVVVVVVVSVALHLFVCLCF